MTFFNFFNKQNFTAFKDLLELLSRIREIWIWFSIFQYHCLLSIDIHIKFTDRKIWMLHDFYLVEWHRCFQVIYRTSNKSDICHHPVHLSSNTYHLLFYPAFLNLSIHSHVIFTVLHKVVLTKFPSGLELRF